ncbi:TatD family hydrolase [Alkalihalobacillus sp. BA299]|uniref:TatD family hydrolase n=1 Tax=Alkalihalobacillus sp. BA299 TaxID=2815938 RepID=UPI001ADD4C17|nr:TatD family hydrolase [Alkalihalobacillus sp. BA299]
MIDSHIHLYQYDDIEKRINHWQEEGVERVVAVSNDLKSSYETLELKQKYPQFIYAGVGYHPEQKPMIEKEMHELSELIQTEKKHISLIGEVGLPYYTLHTLTENEQRQHMEQLQWWCEIAKLESLPLVLHAVHSQAEQALTILKQTPELKAHFHWLKAKRPVVEEIVTAGHYISFTPEICYRERDQILAQFVPLSQLLIETDGPWPYNGPFEHIETTPLLLVHIIQMLAEIKHEVKSKIFVETTENAKHLFGN